MTFPALEIHQVHKCFGSVQALQGIDLTVQQGEFFALLGPNGAGKSTLINILAGLALADGGKLAILGHDVRTDYRQARRSIGVVPQELVYDAFFTVREMLHFQSGYFGIRNNKAWIDELLERLALTDKADAYVRHLSGGMKRRVLVAQALVHKPPVIVLDEPTAGVDVELRQSLWAFIRCLNQQGHTIVLTTHYLEEAEALCNRVAMLKQGQVVALDTTANLLSRHAGIQLRLKISPASLPDTLKEMSCGQDGEAFKLSLSHHAEMEKVLAVLRESGVVVEDMEVVRPDLEDVFLELLKS